MINVDNLWIIIIISGVWSLTKDLLHFSSNLPNITTSKVLNGATKRLIFFFKGFHKRGPLLYPESKTYFYSLLLICILSLFWIFVSHRAANIINTRSQGVLQLPVRPLHFLLCAIPALRLCDLHLSCLALSAQVESRGSCQLSLQPEYGSPRCGPFLKDEKN